MGMGSGSGLDLAPYKMPIIGGFFQDPNELHQKKQMHNMAASYGNYRPEMQQAQMNALANTATMFQPYGNAMSQMYGAGSQMQMPTNSPVSSRMTQIGNPRSNNTRAPENPAMVDWFGGDIEDTVPGTGEKSAGKKKSKRDEEKDPYRPR